MKLRSDWNTHLDVWIKKLVTLFYTPIGDIHYQGFTTFERLSLEEAKALFASGRAVAMPTGTRWGELNEYAWLAAEIRLPETFHYPGETKEYPITGQHIIMNVNPGGESTLYVNDTAFGTRRNDFWLKMPHHFIVDQTLTTHARPADSFRLVMEALSTTGPRECGCAPLLKGEEAFPDHTAPYTKVGVNNFGVWNEEIYQLFLEVTALREIAQSGAEGSSRTKNIWQALRRFTVTVDFSDTMETLLKSVREAREQLRPLLKNHNGDSQATLYAFGHAHIDVAWLWPLTETMRKCARTFAGQLRHLERYPDYVFLQSQPQLYQMTKELYPELYGRIKEKVAEGRFIPEGGMWVEADTNLTGGESLIRQFIHGKRFFREEFGLDNELLWLPDVFGYTAALPQIMKGCGIKYFSTCKIFWDYGGGEKFPYNYFNWIGMDGSRVTAFIHDDYSSFTNPAALIDRWENRRQQDLDINEFLVPFGYGDGGGGPARDHIEYVLLQKDLEGAPKVRLASPLEFFHDLENRGALPSEEYAGELYFHAHRGTYTSQAKIKRGNRLCELALREMEMLSCAALNTGNYVYPYDAADCAWKKLLLNQFHDILPGSSVGSVYETARKQHQEVLDFATETAASCIPALCAADSGSLTVFNSISWARKALIPLPEDYPGLAREDGQTCPIQQIGNTQYALTELKPLGFTNFLRSDTLSQPDAPYVTATETLLENTKLRAVFNEYGEIISLYNKETQTELADGRLNSFRMYQDMPSNYDAWDIEAFYTDYPVTLNDKAIIEVVTSGPLAGVVKITRRLHASVLTQYVTLLQDCARLDFTSTLHWHETQKLLKVCFPVNVHAKNALHEIQFGYLERPTHFSTQMDKDRFEVCNHKWSALADSNHGIAVLNDCKYGVNVRENSINLTLMTSSVAPDKEADRGMNQFTYSLYAWDGPFLNSQVEKEAYSLNCPVKVMNGSASFQLPLAKTDADNIVIDTIKPAEDRSGDIIIRLYECMNAAVRTEFTTSLSCREICPCNMLEEPEGESISGNTASLSFRPFEIKTLRLKK